ncbi:tRNA pseudouridine(55) synthase TruB [Spiribacter sp. 2438]|uniref:tRNA pseudouridine(55) synthase TruB n=1 Tax=Spiribacter sp. 2438 TaxID=2666185 RepID=UPI0012B01F3D|nr:tRNA pseudouridine(55) synthase TruB [Spiribacter sp. 2438]QGM21363.1 tRNA pseudouridine(55) synthase TruB [Spiribacter sp. 2438]
MARKSGRDVHGILLLDKPPGQTSNRVLRRVSRLLDARKAGHTGSLDPLATGLLVACFGEATKLSGWLLDADKTYVATARLGVTTDSGDADGRPLQERVVPPLAAEALEEILAGFRGEQQQIPPMFSALKHDGRRLHELARAGQTVDRPPRRVVIHELRGEPLSADQLRLEVRCSKGTYIRSLVEDIGEKLGCGAHVETLRRTGLGPFRDPAMQSPEVLEAEVAKAGSVESVERHLLPIHLALSEHPSVALDGPRTRRFQQGQAVEVTASPDAAATAHPSTDSIVAVFESEGRFLGVGEWAGDHWLKPRRLLVHRTPEG